jgi:pimeloyl-ACP methyl ester carboxylesterase
MSRIGHAIYLHGFASSPASTKARWFARALAAHDVGMSCPDFNLPDFETLTVTRMVGQAKDAARAAPSGPVALIGSSLGAFVAVLTAVADPGGPVDRIVLLAPALDFGGNRLRELGGHGIAEWRARGRLPVFHYADQQMRDVGFALYEDAAAYDALTLDVPVPTLAFQGTRDVSVNPEMVQRWAATQPRVDLRLLDDDHQLTASVETIWPEIERFFGLKPR